MKRIGLLLVAASLFGCVPASAQLYVTARMQADLLPALRPNDSVKVKASLPWVSTYQPPAVYATWWVQIAACEKLTLPVELLSKVRWVQVNSTTFRRALENDSFYGYTQADRNTIIIAQGKVLDPMTVMHEMLHQLYWWNAVDEGPDFHPYDGFEACGLHITQP